MFILIIFCSICCFFLLIFNFFVSERIDLIFKLLIFEIECGLVNKLILCCLIFLL